MAGAEDVPIPPETAEISEEHRKRIPLVWIPATLGVGLLIAVVYLGGRIVTAHPHPRAAAGPVVAPATANPPKAVIAPVANPAVEVSPAPPVQSPAPEPALPVNNHPPAAATNIDDGFPMITPLAGQRYVQVGALDLSAVATQRFVERLRNEKLDPHVAASPKPELMRVLIGPFEDSGALEARKTQLEAEGIATFVRQY